MTGVNCKEDTKAEFDRLKPDAMTNDEFVATLLETYENADESVTIDTEAITENISESVASKIELAAYRGVTEAIEQAQ